jgi:KDO2-lipid IV(A) lauroyltransferase
VTHGLRYEPIAVVARQLDNPQLDARLCAFRSRGGNTVIYKRRALQQILQFIRRRETVAILIDQNVQAQDGIFVDFFGRPAATTTVAAAVALKTGCALLPSRAVALPDGRYRLVYGAPVPAVRTGDHDADIARVTQALTKVIEDWVREVPDQWLWVHRRWKTQPPPAALRSAG